MLLHLAVSAAGVVIVVIVGVRILNLHHTGSARRSGWSGETARLCGGGVATTGGTATRGILVVPPVAFLALDPVGVLWSGTTDLTTTRCASAVNASRLCSLFGLVLQIQCSSHELLQGLTRLRSQHHAITPGRRVREVVLFYRPLTHEWDSCSSEECKFLVKFDQPPRANL